MRGYFARVAVNGEFGKVNALGARWLESLFCTWAVPVQRFLIEELTGICKIYFAEIERHILAQK